MSTTTQLATNGIGPLRAVESAPRIRRDALRTELLFCDAEVPKSPQYLELANYIDALGFNCLTYTHRSNYLAVNDKTITALNEILEKHSKHFQAGFIAKVNGINETMRDRGMPEMTINPNDVRTILLTTEIELQDKLPKIYRPLFSAFKETMSALLSPMAIILSISMVGYFMGENFRRSITQFILSQGTGLHILLFGSLFGYGIYSGIIKYKSIINEKKHSERELAHNLKKTMHAAVLKAVSDQTRQYKTTLERLIMTS